MSGFDSLLVVGLALTLTALPMASVYLYFLIKKHFRDNE
jgi:hypothetical protein